VRRVGGEQAVKLGGVGLLSSTKDRLAGKKVAGGLNAGIKMLVIARSMWRERETAQADTGGGGKRSF
jgi:hypothetical protein